MILKKPYAFFIKIFKPLHFLIALLILYCISLNNKILIFLNDYLHSTQNVVGQEITSKYANSLMYIIPIIVVVLSMIILGIMFRKKKTITFYFFTIFSSIFIIIISIYTINFLGVLEKSIVSINSVKLIHDLVLINIMIQGLLLIIFLVRGIGINVKKFNFDSDLSKFEISESDKEEFELNVNIDFDESKRKRKEKFRNLKYSYLENKFIINIVAISVILVIIVLVTLQILNNKKDNKVEGVLYSMSSYNIQVDYSTILNKNYQGNTITDENNSLVVLSLKLSSNIDGQFLHLDNFSLNIGDAKLKPTTKYSSDLLDLGIVYDESVLSTDLTDYLLVYEMPNKYINTSMYLSYDALDYGIDIKLNPINIEKCSETITKNISEEMSLENSLGDIKFKIDNYSIDEYVLINYKYCIKENDCLDSKEYLRPTINTNFDKYILTLNIKYSNNSSVNSNSFYDLLDKFGTIYYKIGDVWNTQNTGFEQIKSKKASESNIEYIGIDSIIKNAEEIKLVFNIRDYRYEYILK